MKKKKQQPNVMVFGVFDRFHPGHLSFLAQARRFGKLTVVVARDSAAENLKRRKPRENEKTRVHAIEKLPFISRVVLGDRVQGSYAILKKYRPDIICFGYDQGFLEKDVRAKMRSKKNPRVRFVKARSHHPSKFHTSLQ